MELRPSLLGQLADLSHEPLNLGALPLLDVPPAAQVLAVGEVEAGVHGPQVQANPGPHVPDRPLRCPLCVGLQQFPVLPADLLATLARPARPLPAEPPRDLDGLGPGRLGMLLS